MMTVRHSLLLLIGVFSIVPMFCRLVGRGSLGRVCHCGEVVSHRDASGDDPFHGCRKSARSHPHDAWRVSEEQREKGPVSREQGEAELLAPTSGCCFNTFVTVPPKQGEIYMKNYLVQSKHCATLELSHNRNSLHYIHGHCTTFEKHFVQKKTPQVVRLP